MKISKPVRHFVKPNLVIDNWDSISVYFENLVNRKIATKNEFLQWLKDQSELAAILEEDLAWRYIKMTIDTKNEAFSKLYNLFVSEIQAKIAPFEDKLNQLIINSEYVKDFEGISSFHILFRKITSDLGIYRENNISLISEVAEESKRFGEIAGAQSVEYNSESLTMQRASLLLKEQDEKLRETIFRKIAARRKKDILEFDELFESLLKKRHQIAVNAGHENYRDYKLVELGRFDYSAEDCFDFHASIRSEIVPIANKLKREKLDKLGKNKFKPWDLDVDPEGLAPLRPFEKGKELVAGTVRMFNKIDPFFGDCLLTMEKMNHLDIESKEGKAPGGYNYPLYEIGVPFIFMNAVGSHRDLVTMVHEGGHAIQSFLSRDLELTGFKSLPSEVAELASMSMELLSMEEWNEFYQHEKDLKRAKKEQLETIIQILPWIAQVDEFQHWVYVNHDHTRDQRTAKWLELCSAYGSGLTDWSGYDDVLSTSWQRQMHIFEVPFYYIEYGIAQLGALSIWKNSIRDKPGTISKYKDALSLAYTKSIPDIYKTAGISFDFTAKHIKDLAKFIEIQRHELN